MSQAALRATNDNDGGRFVFIASSAGMFGQPNSDCAATMADADPHPTAEAIATHFETWHVEGLNQRPSANNS